MPRKNVKELYWSEFISNPNFFVGQVRRECMPIIILSVGAVVQGIRADELDKLNGRIDRPSIDVIGYPLPTIREFIDDKQTAYISDGRDFFLECLVSFEALHEIKEMKPEWSNRWIWPE